MMSNERKQVYVDQAINFTKTWTDSIEKEANIQDILDILGMIGKDFGMSPDTIKIMVSSIQELAIEETALRKKIEH